MSDLSHRLARAHDLLQRHFGFPDFRPAQRRVVQSVLAGHDTLAVLPTGGGKSVCFQVPALVLEGITVVISPLISLMQDQVEALRRRGVTAEFLNSTQSGEAAAAILRRLCGGDLRMVYISPERLTSLAGDLRRLNCRPALLAVDESHCISEWGHDFRPSYRDIARARYLLGNPPVVALTGSATPEVRDDIARSLRLKNHRLILGSFDRPNLWFGVVRVAGEAARWTALRRALAASRGMCIVYTATRGQAELVTQALREHGYRASPYHAGLHAGVRERILHAFLADDVDVVVATSAFGMGIDKATVRLVVHWIVSPTMESYYQEAGRAGRDGSPARCIALYHPGDSALARRQLETTLPPRRLLERTWRSGPPPGTPQSVLESAERLRRELRPQDGPIAWEAIEARRSRATARLAAMERYARSRRCRRGLVLRYFGEVPGSCSGCDRCSGMPAELVPPGPLAELARRWVGVQI